MEREIIKIDDPTIKTFQISASQVQYFEIRRKDCPFSDDIRLVLSRKKSTSTVLDEFKIDDGLEFNGEWIRYKIDGRKYKRQAGRKLALEFFGYENGARQMIHYIIINKSAG